MSRAAKWKLEKAKVKVVFRLQFHATHIPQSGWEKLFISFIPIETGKAIAKTSKANVRNGACKWADPIYETTRLLLDSRSKQYDDKLYKLVVGMGTSRSSILGEATINLAEYGDASQPSAIALPLLGSDHGTILHVTVQLLTGKTGFREFEQQRDKGLQSGNNAKGESEQSPAISPSSELQIPNDQVNKAKTQIPLGPQSKELPSVVEETGIHEEYSDSQVTGDGSSNASENYFADKHDSLSTQEVDSLKSRSQTSPTKQGEKDLAISYEENHRLRGSLEAAESSISELKIELTALQTHANEMGSETQKVAQELAAEIASGQELAKEVTVLKSECSKFKNELEQLKEKKSSSRFMERKVEQTEHEKQLRWVKGVVGVEDQIRELQEKVFRESDLSFLNADLDVLLSTVQHLKKGTVEPESLRLFDEIQSLPRQEGSTGTTGSTDLELLSIAKAERESLVRKMDQMECYYEALVQELEENQKRILVEFQSLRNEHSTCAFTISTCKAETESIRHDMNDQMLKFTEEIRELGSINKELQRRATTSESALKRARLNYSIAVSQLQKDLDMLSFQVLSMFETNQNVIKEAFSDTSQASSQGHPDEPNHPLVSRVQSKSASGGDVLSDDLKKSLSLQENIYKKVEEELGEMSSANLYLDVYSGTLQETLLEASTHIRKMKAKLEESSQELELSNQSRDLLFERLQTAVDDVRSLNGQNTYYLAKCNDLQVQNQMLEADLGNLSNENFLLMEKITECEALLMDYRVYKSKHEVLSAEKLELERLLEIQVLDNQNLQKDLENIQKDLEKERDMAAVSLSAARSEIDDVKTRFKQGLDEITTKLDMPNSSLEKLQLKLDSVATNFKNSLESGERHVQNSEVLLTYLSSLELELQKMSSEDKNFVEQIKGLDMMAKEFEKSTLAMSELKQEKQDLMISVANKNEESAKLLSELDKLKESLRFVNDELDVERGLKSKLEGSVASLTLELESHRSELGDVKKLASDRELENSQVVQLLSQHEKSHEIMICEDLKHTFVKTQYETWIEELREQVQVLSKQCGELEKMHLDNEANLNQCRASEARNIEENKELMTTLKSLRMELEASTAQNSVLSDSINVLKCELEQYKGKVGVLEASLMEVKSEHTLEVGQLKEIQRKFDDTEARLNRSLESEACYIEENRNLAAELESGRLEYRNLTAELESVRLELEASIAQNAEISESNNVLEIGLTEVNNRHAVEVGRLKDMLATSEAEVGNWNELQMKLHDTEARLNDLLESEARYIEDNQKLSTTLDSVRSELEASTARNAEISESNNVLEISLAEVNNQHAVEVVRLKGTLASFEVEVGKWKELEMKLLDTEARLNHSLENEARYIEENRKLSTTLESVRFELEASISESNNVLEQWKDKTEKLEISLAEVNNQHAVEVGRLKDMLASSEAEVGQQKELEMKLLDTNERLDHCVKSEARYIEENGRLSRILESLQSELDAAIAQNTALSSSNNVLMVELEQYTGKMVNNKPKSMLAESESEVDGLLFSQEESEIVSVVLKAKLDEQNNELIMLQNKCNDLAKKLSEQILKTEEFKNLSIYLKELKDNADVAREKRDPEGPSESLRMAFVKEQYQTKVQELKQQLSVSKRHGEEMLFKLQDALDEIESRKKSEAEKSKRIAELETEVQSAASDKPDYDRIRAELECAVLSLECCKEEKEKLVALLQDCEEEKSRIGVELSSIKEQLAQKKENGVSDKQRRTDVNGSMDHKEVKYGGSIQTGEAEHSVSPRAIQDGALVSEGIDGVTEHASTDEETLSLNDSRQLTVVNDQFRAQHLRSCMEQLDEELEKMKNDNSLLPLANYDPSFQDLQRELVQLRKANEELGSIYPNFVDLPGNGNALERVLALEIELAEALKTKKKSSVQFQSSFLKQHSDEEAVFKSFKDINELIKDMLEIKGKYVNVENELKEMHDRYSQLSLQFAEVEGERQKLMMTLKNVRSSKNLLRLNRSSIAALEDHPL